MGGFLLNLGIEPEKHKSKKEVKAKLGRQWGEDVPFTENDICAVFDKAAGIMYIIGGRGCAERVVDSLNIDDLHMFGKKKGYEGYPYKVVLTPNTKAYSYGVAFDEGLPWKSVIVVRNSADFKLRVR